jgi:hypothetical protein
MKKLIIFRWCWMILLYILFIPASIEAITPCTYNMCLNHIGVSFVLGMTFVTFAIDYIHYLPLRNKTLFFKNILQVHIALALLVLIPYFFYGIIAYLIYGLVQIIYSLFMGFKEKSLNKIDIIKISTVPVSLISIISLSYYLYINFFNQLNSFNQIEATAGIYIIIMLHLLYWAWFISDILGDWMLLKKLKQYLNYFNQISSYKNSLYF